MEITKMGKVVVEAEIESLQDAFDARRGRLPAESVRSVVVRDALVDTGATMLSLPRKLIEELGLVRLRTRTARTSAGTCDFAVYDAVRLVVHGRDCVVEVAEVPDDCPVLMGKLPLEALDFVVDPIGQRLIGNPDHGGERMIDMF